MKIVQRVLIPHYCPPPGGGGVGTRILVLYTIALRILHDFALKFTPKQAFLRDMFEGVCKMTPKCPLIVCKKTLFLKNRHILTPICDSRESRLALKNNPIFGAPPAIVKACEKLNQQKLPLESVNTIGFMFINFLR